MPELLFRGALSLLFALAVCSPLRAQEAGAVAEVAIGYLGQEVERLPPLSLVDPVMSEEGVLGARLGIADSNTTGQFTGQHFSLAESVVPVGGDVAAAFKALVASGPRLIVADLPAAELLAVAGLPEAADTLIFNVRAKDDALRGASCRANLLHVMPSYAMLADGLAQYLLWKRWTRWLLVVGAGPDDALFAAALKRAARRFSAEIVEERSYDADPGARRSDTGHVQIQKQIPVFTQEVEYDVLVVSDVRDAFGQYLPYRTWLPRPVVGTHGLVPLAWHRSLEQWGGTQMQNRFTDFAGRWMGERDYAAWVAVRSISEATTRTQATDLAAIAGYLHSEAFGLAGFKGQKLTFRDWDGQLRQPILLAEARTIVSVSPQEGFLHEASELDTLGVDRPETECRM